MNYPGNQAISPEVQQRIRSTFEQTLGLAEKGSRQEAILGCDFILQLDPQFLPAQTLQHRLEGSAEGGVEVDDLRAQMEGRQSAEDREAEAAALFEETRPGLVAGPAAGSAEGEAPAAGNETILADSLPDLGPPAGEGGGGGEPDDGGDPFDLDDLPELPAPGADEGGVGGGGGGGVGGADEGDELPLPDLSTPDLDLPDEGAAGAPGAGAEDDLRSQLEAKLEARQFEDALALAQANRDRVAGDPELARLATLAGERNEAAPYVERFLSAAAKARQAGDADEAATLTEKARSLDPSHPALAEAGPAGAPAPGAAPDATAGDGDAGGDDLGVGDAGGGDDAGDLDLDDFDFGSGDEEGDRRIAELLADGQGAFEREDYQGAIDAWSRIFLIDIDHEEASRRIEEARRLKNEEERRVEEIFHQAVEAAEEGREEEAREGFQRVLSLSPGYAAAVEQLDRLDSGQGPAPAAPQEKAPPAPPDGEKAEDDEILREQIMIPPEPGQEGEAAVEGGVEGPKGRTMVAGSGPSRAFMLVAGLVLVVVLVGGYFVYQQRDSLFPNAAETPAEAPADVDPVERATRLHEGGKTAMAVNMLRRLPPSAPQYEEAQALISQWEAESQPEEVAPEPAEEVEEEAVSQGDLLAAASAAADAGEYLRARDLLTEAEALAGLPPDGIILEERVETALEPVASAITLMEQGEYTRALPGLWRQHEANPENMDVRLLITDSYYNLAIRALQQGDARTAAEHLEEAVEMSPEPGLERHLRFARTYAERDKDLLYRIYVKYLPAR